MQVRHADYAQPETLAPALEGTERLLLISGTPGDRVAQHANVIDAAKQPGVQLIAYTGILNADITTMLLAADHQATSSSSRTPRCRTRSCATAGTPRTP